ncbi:Fic family protein [Saccharicrinis fermentans]|uniref:Fic family protein n=1 Tax=Saccharicrinis fermentans TaxID=982 RepID=UPI003908B780
MIQQEKLFIPQDKQEILDLLSNFIEYFNQEQNEISPLINLAVLHHQFESIHPFYDGNGRTEDNKHFISDFK